MTLKIKVNEPYLQYQLRISDDASQGLTHVNSVYSPIDSI